MLVDDMEEFTKLVPKAASRLKIKKFVRECNLKSVSLYIVMTGL